MTTELAGLTSAVAVARIRLRQDADLTEPSDPEEPTRIEIAGRTLSVPARGGGARTALRLLARADCAEADLVRTVREHDGDLAVLRWQALVFKLDGAGLLEHAIGQAGDIIARLRPTGTGPVARATPVGRDVMVKLSRFAVLRADKGALTLAVPFGNARVDLCREGLAVVGTLTDWTSPEAVAAAVPGLTTSVAAAILGLLSAAGALAPGGPDHDDESTDYQLAQWSVHDLWLHARSRSPGLQSGYGGSYPLADRFPPLPAVPPRRPGRRLALAAPNLDQTARADPPLTAVLENRRSVREHYDDAPITADQLAELLYRAARTRRTFRGTDGQEVADRPYPSGGSLHALEIYPLINRCDGIPGGLWHYASADHELEAVSDPSPATAALVAAARASSVMSADPQVVLIVTARFGRAMWKYATIAYSLVLKDVGALYQTIYLVASAMGLAVCGLGGGDAATFAAAAGLDPRSEGSVGEMTIGSRSDQLSSGG